MKSILDFLFMKKGIMIFLFIAFILGGYFANSRREKIVSSYEFNGRVEDILYDVKGIPTITVKQKEYYLDRFGINYRLNVGDSIIKKKNEMSIIIVKQGDGKEIILNE